MARSAPRLRADAFRPMQRLLKCRAMRLRQLVLFSAILTLLPFSVLLAEAVVEGRVELPKSHSALAQTLAHGRARPLTNRVRIIPRSVLFLLRPTVAKCANLLG